jgi:hypothetical protein
MMMIKSNVRSIGLYNETGRIIDISMKGRLKLSQLETKNLVACLVDISGKKLNL